MDFCVLRIEIKSKSILKVKISSANCSPQMNDVCPHHPYSILRTKRGSSSSVSIDGAGKVVTVLGRGSGASQCSGAMYCARIQDQGNTATAGGSPTCTDQLCADC